MRIQFKIEVSRQKLNNQFKYLSIVLLFTLVLTPFESGAQTLQPTATESTIIDVSKGVHEDYIEIRLSSELLKSWRWSVRRKLQYSGGNYDQLQTEDFQPQLGGDLIIKDEAIEKGKAYIYELVCMNEYGLQIYQDTGHCSELIDKTWYTVEITKGCFADAVQIYIQTNDPSNFHNCQFFKIFRRRRHTDDDWEKIDKKIHTVILDGSTIPNEEYDYRIKFKDNSGNDITLEDYGYRVGPAPRAVITQALTPQSILVGWDAEIKHSKYRVQVREAGGDTESNCRMMTPLKTIIDDVVNEHFYVISLPDSADTQGKKFEWRVRGEETGKLSDYTDWTTVDKTLIKPTYTPREKPLSSNISENNEIISFIRAYLSKPKIKTYSALRKLKLDQKCVADHYDSKYRAIEVSHDLQITVPFKFNRNRRLRADTVKLINTREVLLEKLILLSDQGEILYNEAEVQELPIGCNAIFTGSDWKQSVKKSVIFYIELSYKDKAQHYPVLVNLDVAEARLPFKEKIQMMIKRPQNY